MLTLIIAIVAAFAAEPYQRSMAERAAYVAEHPCPEVNGKGKCLWVVDHVVPICACAGDEKCLKRLDHRSNMAWQKHGKKPGESVYKDGFEKAACAAIRRTLKKSQAQCVSDFEEPTEDEPAPSGPALPAPTQTSPHGPSPRTGQPELLPAPR